MLFGFGLVHSHYIGSMQDDTASKGWYTTVSDNELIVFPKQLNCIEIFNFSATEELGVTFNNDTHVFWVEKGGRDGIYGLPVNRMRVMAPAGTKIKWRGLVGIQNT